MKSKLVLVTVLQMLYVSLVSCEDYFEDCTERELQ